jgi:hypothetical protein
MTFHVGQKVVCVNASGLEAVARRLSVDVPKQGAVYTIRSFYISDGVFLEEVRNPPNPGYPEWDIAAWHAWRFRPIRETDISIFTAMLNRAKAPELIS